MTSEKQTPSQARNEADLKAWQEHPITKQFIAQLQERANGLERGMLMAAYVYGEPSKTAENCAQYAARINELYVLIEVLSAKETPDFEPEVDEDEADDEETV